MATNKNAQIRYNALDRCFRNIGRNYTFENLLEVCNNAIYDFDPSSEGIKKRQLYDDLKYMQSEQGWSVEFEEGLRLGRKKIYRYTDPKFSISKGSLNESDINYLKTAIISLSRLQYDWADELAVRLREEFKIGDEPRKIIEFEENKFLLGKEYITELYNAILYKKVLKINYHGYKSKLDQEFILSPYYLKQYNNRWFLFGRDDRFETLSNLALDRIKSFQEVDEIFIDSNIDFEEYFEDVIGVTVPRSKSIKITIRVSGNSIKYVRSKPLHGSQKIKEEFDNYTIVEYDLIPNFEFESQILSFGENIQILSPKDLGKSIKERLKSSLNNYDNYAD